MPGPTKAQRAATAERRRKAIAMKLAGATYEQIATALGYASRGAACVDIQRALEQSLAEQHRDAEVMRHELVLQLEQVKRAMWPAMLNGDTKAADVVLKAVDRIAKLVGADAPTRVEVLTMGAIESEIAKLEAQIAAQAAGEEVPAEPGGLVGGPEARPAP